MFLSFYSMHTTRGGDEGSKETWKLWKIFSWKCRAALGKLNSCGCVKWSSKLFYGGLPSNSTLNSKFLIPNCLLLPSPNGFQRRRVFKIFIYFWTCCSLFCPISCFIFLVNNLIAWWSLSQHQKWCWTSIFVKSDES